MIIYGLHPVIAVIKNKKEIIKQIYATKKLKEIPDNLNIKFISPQELEKITNTKEHQGIACKIESFPYVDFDDEKNNVKRIVILDHIEDPRNVGAILRNAFCFEFDLVIIPKDRACDITPTVIKTSAGCAFNLKIAKVVNINDTIRKLKDEFFTIYGLEANGTKEVSEIKPLNKKIALVLGSEKNGISSLTRKLCDEICYIDMNRNANSLNVATATGIAMYILYSKFKI